MTHAINQKLVERAPSGSSLELKSDDFFRIVNRLQKLTGIVIKEHKHVMVQTRISERVKQLGFDGFASYLDFLDLPDGESELENFCNALTTNLTSFFREDHHFLHFSDELARLKTSKSNRFRVWSAGCSTGEEAYSIALILLQKKVKNALPDTKILATDIDTTVLKAAKAARYSLSELDRISNFNDRKIATVDGPEFTFTKEVRELVAFKGLNLQHEWPMKGSFDAIFCRNVLIYFSAETKAKLISRFAQALKPNGILYLGHSERILTDHKQLKAEGKTTYRKLNC